MRKCPAGNKVSYEKPFETLRIAKPLVHIQRKLTFVATCQSTPAQKEICPKIARAYQPQPAFNRPLKRPTGHSTGRRAICFPFILRVFIGRYARWYGTIYSQYRNRKDRCCGARCGRRTIERLV
ncbi:hypothetical protein [Pareuzebyella sediminis]|uniref:hypothetical protein n=1 Tax=Pareuzebyella sediminis TaxID=2607998 RepID=UPI0011EC32EE|nr:hypothetical protein [Pareuzebyella sediminis]